jgi:DNA-binding response OmpR family regulator
MADLPLSIDHPQGGSSHFLVYGRNLSRSGLAALHGGYVHTGSRCRVVLEDRIGQRLAVDGTVRYCRLIAGSAHELGIAFREPIEPSRFRLDDGGDGDEALPPAAAGRVISLEARLLLADAFVPDLLLLDRQLSTFGPELVTVATPGAALDAVRRGRFDAVLSGLSVSGPDGLRWLAAMREAGHAGPLLVLTAETDTAAHRRAQEAGATSIVAKPYHLELLVAEIQARVGGPEPPARLDSTVAEQPGMAALVARFVELARRAADQVLRLQESGEWTDLAETCRQLKSAGCGYGFPALTVAAIAVLNALARDPAAEATREPVERLVAVCRSLTAPGAEAA